MTENKKHRKSSRREFLAGGAMLGAGIALGSEVASAAQDKKVSSIMNSARIDAPYELSKASNKIYSACLQCNTGCGISAKLQDGVVVKIDGNPYNPWTMLPHIPYATGVDTASVIDGSICPKGQSGLQTAYDPYRIRKVLKRAGKRGENKWIVVSFDQAIKEIAEGGKIFAHVPGEAERNVEGLS
ncbi:MAG: hypothetical protein QG577_2061, partial [Thermodesulfobacteriota bacterium]|nr:hypothetical protein [Thermodesulfobacteriota bacterium]